VKKEVMIQSKLLEHVGQRIMTAIQKEFPVIQSVGLKISKMNPPMEGKVNNVSVFLTNQRQ
jgi:7,8-dihydroneopterin aldolase/epimerase/oxygenase